MGPERSEHARPFRVIPFGALVRRKGSDDTGLVVAYVIHHNGPIEYLVKMRSGRVFLPHHEAVPIRYQAASRGEGKGKAHPGESEAAAIDAAAEQTYPAGEES